MKLLTDEAKQGGFTDAARPAEANPVRYPAHMATSRFEIKTGFDVSLPLTVRSHGWVGLSPWSWDAESEVLSRPDRLAAGQVVTIEVTQPSPRMLSVAVAGDASGDGEARTIVERWLSLDWSSDAAVEVAEKIDTSIAEIIRTGGGRMLRCSTFYEDFVKTICTIQINWAGTQRMVDRLVELSGDGLFPVPEAVIDAGEAGLRSEVKLGFRAPVVFDATRKLLDEGLLDEHGRADEERITYDLLIGLRGIGPYAANHLAMLLHDFSRIPVDSEVSKYCKERYGIEPEDVEAHFDEWGDYRFLGYRLDRVLRRIRGR